MNENKKNYYTVSEVYENVFLGALSKTTIHQLIKKGKIPSVVFLSKKLIPAWWVLAEIEKANHKPVLVKQTV
jgi:hypothetical protein